MLSSRRKTPVCALCILPRCPFCQHKNVDGCILAYRARRNNRAGRSEREHEANKNAAAIERHLQRLGVFARRLLPVFFVLLASDVQPLFSKIFSLVEAIWTAEDLPSMAEGSTMAAGRLLPGERLHESGGRPRFNLMSEWAVPGSKAYSSCH